MRRIRLPAIALVAFVAGFYANRHPANGELWLLVVALAAFVAGYASRALKPLLGGGEEHAREKPVYISPAFASERKPRKRL